MAADSGLVGWVSDAELAPSLSFPFLLLLLLLSTPATKKYSTSRFSELILAQLPIEHARDRLDLSLWQFLEA